MNQTEKSKKEYKNFGIIVGVILFFIFGIIVPYYKYLKINYYFLTTGIVLIFLSLTLPNLLKYPYQLWMKVGEVLGWINTRILLGVVFFIVLFPIGILLFLFGKRPIRINKLESETFKQKSIERTWNHYEKPF